MEHQCYVEHTLRTTLMNMLYTPCPSVKNTDEKSQITSFISNSKKIPTLFKNNNLNFLFRITVESTP